MAQAIPRLRLFEHGLIQCRSVNISVLNPTAKQKSVKMYISHSPSPTKQRGNTTTSNAYNTTE